MQAAGVEDASSDAGAYPDLQVLVAAHLLSK